MDCLRTNLCQISQHSLCCFSITPSQVCGPYQGYNKTTQIITDVFDDWQEDATWIKDILEFMTSTAFMIGVAVALWYVMILRPALQERNGLAEASLSSLLWYPSSPPTGQLNALSVNFFSELSSQNV